MLEKCMYDVFCFFLIKAPLFPFHTTDVVPEQTQRDPAGPEGV